MKKGRQDRAGSSLLEVIVAFALLAIALGTLLPAMSGLLSRSAIAERTWAATAFARSKLEEIGIAIPLREGVVRGTYREDWHWTATITPYARSGVPIGAGLYEVTLEVRGDGNSDPLARLVTVRQRAPER